MTPTNDNEITISSSAEQSTSNLVTDLVGLLGSRFDAAVAVRDAAQAIIKAEQDEHAKRLRQDLADLQEKLAAKQTALKAAGKLIGRPPGRPRKTAKRKRKDLEAPVTA